MDMEKTDLKTQLAEVAERIRTMREITGLSEEEMAKCTGVSKEEYEQCEAGEKDFSFTFIYKCAQRFGIDPTDLIKGVSPTLSSYTVNRKGDGLPITRRQGFKYLNMAPLFKNKTAEPFFVTMPYEEAQQNVAIKLSTHAGQELDIILKGTMKVQVGSHIEVLREGDSIYYNSGTPHGMIAVDGQECQFYAIVLKGSEEFAPEQDRFQKLIDQHLARQERETVSSPFVKTQLDENGILKSIRFEHEEKFNFAFDIVDKLAEKSQDKLAMLHVSRDKVERRFTFGDISRWSAKTANYLESLGIQRGDRVMVVLKRHYQFWFVITALHKMGAVIIPATNLLMEHDFDYRFKAAGVKAILCTADGQVADEAEKAAKNCPTVEVKIMENRVDIHVDCGDDSGLLIGREGQTLAALQYLTSRIVSRRMEAPVRVQFDVGDYRERQDDRLRELALALAERVRATGRPCSTRPMSSYHRRLVHMALQDSPDVQTRSSGEGPLKRVIIQRRRQERH